MAALPTPSPSPSIDDKTSPSKGKYRPEIDGLRAFAVVAVIINHFNKDLLPSGYLGVDIFFVISGYVITSSLAGRESKNFLDFLTGFYERRIKRLVPALVVFVLITSILISLFNPDPRVALGVGWRSLFGVSNINLYRSATDYFAQSTELNPFTHTWSLGVEEQFYLLFPFLIWFSGFGRQAAKGARNLFFWVGALTVVSLISFIYLYQVNQPAAYFLMPPRFWEMAAGCLILIGFQKRAKIEQSLEQVPPLLVVAAMVGVMFLPSDAAVPATIAIVALSAVLVTCLKKGTAAYNFFTLEKVVDVGLISYSLYLWHWSVLSISRWTIGIHWWSVPIQAGLMLLLAIGSFRWIEQPFRRAVIPMSRSQVFKNGVGMVGASSVVLIGIVKPLNNHLYMGQNRSAAADPYSQCSRPKEKDTSSTICIVNNPTDYDRTVWIVGDSHAGALLEGAKNIFTGTRNRVILHTADGTPFPPVGKYRKSEKVNNLKKLESYDGLEKQLMKSFGRSDLLIIAMRMPYHFGGTYYEYPESDFVFLDDNGRETNQSKYFALWMDAVDRLAKQFGGANIIVMTPTPEWKDAALLECSEQKEWFSRLSGKECKIAKNSFVGESGLHSPIIRGLKTLSSKNRNIVLYDAFSRLCPGEFCKFSEAGNLLYRDDDHISPFASTMIMKDLAKMHPSIVLGHSH
jgi:peptidoglycan/LPS O-acetylase OafA/YrhL